MKDIEEGLLTIENVEYLTRMGKSTIYKMVANGEFPPNHRVVRPGPGRHTRWHKEEIFAWILRQKGLTSSRCG